MKFTGTLKHISAEWDKVTLTIDIRGRKQIEDCKELLRADYLDISVSERKKKRSLNANSYFHVLNDKLADKLGISKQKCKNILIGRYGQPRMVDEYQEAVIKTNIPVEKMLEDESVHCMPCGSKEENGKEVVFYKIMRGSSTYDTKEMSVLINGTVDECKEQGIETLPPAEINKMLEAWRNRHE